jgi:ArsR family transcriptional regulator
MDANQALESLAALGQETRLETFRLLMRTSPNGLNAGEIARQLQVVQNTMSSHLTILTRASLLTAERDGRNICYRANHDAIAAMLRFLMEDCCQGSPGVCEALTQAIACTPVAAAGLRPGQAAHNMRRTGRSGERRE